MHIQDLINEQNSRLKKEYLNGIDLASLINKNSNEIIVSLTDDYLIKYQYLKDKLFKTNVSIDYNYKKAFASYYKMRFVTQDYRNKFFIAMEEAKNKDKPNFQELSRELYIIDGKHQFSFITKLLNTIFWDFPIYDKYVDIAFRFNRSAIETNKMFEECNNIIEHISNTYKEIYDKKLIEHTLVKFNNKFGSYEIPFVKKIDFFVWALGKILEEDSK